MINTTNLGLQKPEPFIDNVNIETINGNMDVIDSALGNTAVFETASGTATEVMLTGIVLANGRSKSFIVATNNNGAPTTINGKPLYKPGTTITPKLTAGKAVTVWYNGTNFFIKASAEGTAIAENVLADIPFSNEDDIGIVGTMVDNGPSVAATVNLTTEGAEYTIPKGYHSGLRKIKAVITGLIASVIKAGVTVGGILGTFTADATAVDTNVLTGKTYYRNGVKGTGSMPNKAGWVNALGVDYNTGRIFLKPPEGYYPGAADNYLFFDDPDLIAANFLATKNILGMQGSIPDKYGATEVAGSITADGTGNLNYNQFATGYYTYGACAIKGYDADFIPSKIPSDVNLFGMQGTRAIGKQFASGNATISTNNTPIMYYYGGTGNSVSAPRLIISGLSFTPDLVVATCTTNDAIRIVTTKYVNVYSNDITVYISDVNGTALYLNSGGFAISSLVVSGLNFDWTAIKL
jgi:hypothetical protein